MEKGSHVYQGVLTRYSVLDVDVAAYLPVLDRVGGVEHHQARVSLARKPALHSSHGILNTDRPCPSRRTVSHSSDSLRSASIQNVALYLMRCCCTYVVQHQLPVCLARPAESPHHERYSATVCSIAEHVDVMATGGAL